MKSALVFLALVALSRAGVPLLRTPDERIVNGEDVGVGEIPYQVSLQNSLGVSFCGGSIIHKNYVLTAAHCVYRKNPNNMMIVAGTTDLNEPRSFHRIANVITHLNYLPLDSWKNDIALLKGFDSLQFEFSHTISYVPLPEEGAQVADGSVAVVSGWGSLSTGGPVSMKLQRTNIKIAEQSYCSTVYKSIGYPVYETQICAYDPIVETGSCNGDSGGPLTVNGTLVGIVSWGNNCASREYPTVYTRVSEYIKWINLNMLSES